MTVRRRSWCQRISEVVSRPAVYRGVQMRSQLEADFALHLDHLGVDWDYEPERIAGYLPDFRLVRNEEATYVELKPTIEQAEAAKERIERVWTKHPEAVLLVVSAEQSRWYAAVKGRPWETWVEGWHHR